MSTLIEINQLIDEMKSNAIVHHRKKVAELSQTIVKSPSDIMLHAQLQASLEKLDFLMSA